MMGSHLNSDQNVENRFKSGKSFLGASILFVPGHPCFSRQTIWLFVKKHFAQEKLRKGTEFKGEKKRNLSRLKLHEYKEIEILQLGKCKNDKQETRKKITIASEQIV